MDDDCACLLDRIKCYPLTECDFDEFQVEADVMCQFPIFKSIFDDNCAHYSEHMEAHNALQAGLAWLFCVFVFAGFICYFIVSTQYRDPRKFTQDGCITASALIFTIVVAFIWIGGMVSLFFVLLYIGSGFMIFFGCIYGIDVDHGRTVDGSRPLADMAPSKLQEMNPNVPAANVVYTIQTPSAPALV